VELATFSVVRTPGTFVEPLQVSADREMLDTSARTVSTMLTDLAETGDIDALTVGDVAGADGAIRDGFDGFAPTAASGVFHRCGRGCRTMST